jgi:hypothetical protein
MKLDKRQVNKWTEADVVVELCHRLKLDEIPIRCEVFVCSENHRSGCMRCDVAVVDREEIVCLIEVKDRPEPLHQSSTTRQRWAYTDVTSRHDVPVFYVWGMPDIEAVRAAVNQLWMKTPAKVA